MPSPRMLYASHRWMTFGLSLVLLGFLAICSVLQSKGLGCFAARPCPLSSRRCLRVGPRGPSFLSLFPHPLDDALYRRHLGLRPGPRHVALDLVVLGAGVALEADHRPPAVR